MRGVGKSWSVAASLWLLGCGPGGEHDSTTTTDGSSTSTDVASTTGSSSETGTAPTDPVPGPWDHGWPIPAEPQTTGDPALGEYRLLHSGYLSCGIPYSLWPLARPWLTGFAGEETLPWRDGDNADMPYDWTVHTAPSGVRVASQNCLQCHAGHFNGELVIGLGTADRDFTALLSGALAGVPFGPGIPGTSLAELTKFLDRLQGLGENTVMRTVGTNPAEMIAISLVAHRDVDTLAWQQDPWYEIPAVPVPSDVPPWWRAHKKNALFYNAMARGDHRGTMILATALCTDDVDEAAAIASYFDDIHAYVRSVRPPQYPFPIDAALAAAGEPVFDANCAPCHGTYAEDEADEQYPNLLFPLEVVGTDPVVAEGGTLWAPQLVEWFNASFYGALTRMVVDEPFVGYIAPPLDGIWATAPFLHNGSVPSLALVLDSERRPTYWRRVDYDSTHFDEVNLGWPYVELEQGHDDVAGAEAKLIYDTTQFGHHATGHTFGDHLTDAERRAVLEYLKTL
jgi:mono/diheme cytochrome c family protein